jgi:MscS family membrane protein
VDEYDRGVPRTAVESFIKHAGGGDFEKAAQYLDMRNLPRWMGKPDEQEMARQLKIVIDRGMWLDFDALSEDPKGHANDGLPAYRDTLGRIEMPDKTVDILLQHVPREDGIYIWKFSNRTIAEIPLLYEHYGYHPIEERLSEIFPDVVFLGWYIWQWVLLLIFAGLSYLLAVIVTLLLNLIWRSKESGLSQEVTKFIHGPLRFILWVVGLKWAGHWIGISTTMRGIVRAHTLLTFAFTWAAIRTADIFFSWWTERLLKSGSQAATVLLRPVRTMVRIVIVILGVLVWLDNIGFNISTLLAGMGVGGVAVALAAQDTLKNFIASILILLDKPYMIGERILVKGHDGVVEEIGLRSTRIRELDGHQTIIPNDEMSRLDIENVGRRPHIRRSTTISIAYDTPLAKVEKAVDIIKRILDNHEGMRSSPQHPWR